MFEMTQQEVDELLSAIAPFASKHADELLDLRDLLLNGGHPGKCVRCFFTICQSQSDGLQSGLSTLAKWLERNIELTVSSGSRILERLPLKISPAQNLESYCRGMIRTIRMDRRYPQHCITIRFSYKEAA